MNRVIHNNIIVNNGLNNTQNLKFYNTSIKLYNNGIVELTYLKKTLKVGDTVKITNTRGNGKDSNKDKNLQRARVRAGSTVRELIMANDLAYHWVLTFADEVEDRQQAFHEFMLFIMRLNYKTGKKINYVAVPEIQEKRAEKYGVRVWHFHMAIDVYIKHKVLFDTWGLGGVRVKKHKEGVLGVASYLSKYLKKDMGKYEIQEKKRYLCSKGLKRANRAKIELTGEELSDLRQKTDYNNDFGELEWFSTKIETLKEICDLSKVYVSSSGKVLLSI